MKDKLPNDVKLYITYIYEKRRRHRIDAEVSRLQLRNTFDKSNFSGYRDIRRYNVHVKDLDVSHVTDDRY